MTTLSELHQQAMDVADAAFALRRSGRHEEARETFRRAMNLEARAASTVEASFDKEPTRSILHRSAATLAMHCDDWQSAEKLVAAALRGNPPEQLAEELRDLIEQVHASRHLALRGITLARNEVQLSVAGPAIAPGFAPVREVMRRVEAMGRLLVRRAEQRRARPYRDRAGPTRSVKAAIETFISVPRTASFAITIRIGGHQLELFADNQTAEGIVRETLEYLELLARNEVTALKEKIADEAYFQNFVGLVRQIEPDGENVHQVAFTVVDQDHSPRSVTFVRRQKARAETPPRIEEAVESERVIEHVGRLKFADATKTARHAVKLVLDDKSNVTIQVPDEMTMADIVRPLWGARVRLRAKHRGRTWVYVDIEPQEEPEESIKGP